MVYPGSSQPCIAIDLGFQKWLQSQDYGKPLPGCVKGTTLQPFIFDYSIPWFLRWSQPMYIPVGYIICFPCFARVLFLIMSCCVSHLCNQMHVLYSAVVWTENMHFRLVHIQAKEAKENPNVSNYCFLCLLWKIYLDTQLYAGLNREVTFRKNPLWGMLLKELKCMLWLTCQSY